MTLKLIAFDADDLAIMSVHLEDADLTTAQMAWLPGEKRFAFVCNRATEIGPLPCGVHFDRVTRVERLKMPAMDTAAPLRLIGITFAPGAMPEGQIGLMFDGGAALRLSVECIEAAMRDLAGEDSN